MHLTFIPKSRRAPMTLSRAGDVLTIDGEAFDFSGLPNGATLPRAAIASARIAGDVERDAAGELTVPLYLPHGPTAPEQTRFPEPMTLTADGPVSLPPYSEETPA
ncbi:hypothetical protein [Roseovarius indicus]|uniref:hypothetical protein n=1 Tax=Roseovarius indicus TaxID=540747 RepID=UPI0032EDF7E2